MWWQSRRKECGVRDLLFRFQEALMQEACMRVDFDFLGRPIDLGRREARGKRSEARRRITGIIAGRRAHARASCDM